MQTNILIQKVEPGDFEAVFELLKQLWPGVQLDDDKMRSIFTRNLNSASKRLICARSDQQVVGFCSLTIKEALWKQSLLGNVDELVVDEKWRGKGIGKTLMDSITKIAIEAGCVQLELDSAFHREQAHKFYQNLGFSPRAYVFSKSIQ